MDYPGMDGFLPSRASLIVDVVAVALAIVLPAMFWSILRARNHHNYALHKRIQLTLGIVLLTAVALFEIDIQFVSKWKLRAAESPYIDSLVYPSLYVHLFFAVPTALLWIGVITLALRKFPNPPAPGAHSRAHRLLGWLAAIEMTMTALTGWIFYWLAFVA